MEKKTWKKGISLILMLILLTTFIFGCGQPATDNSSVTGSTETQTPTQTKEKVDIDFWYLWSSESEVALINSLIDEFNSTQDEVNVKGLVSDIQAITVAILGGSGPDVSDDFDSNLAAYADQGILEPLDDYIQESGFDLSGFVESALNTCKYEGKTYALPININTFMLYYNKTLFAEAGLSGPPQTDRELLEYAKKLTKVNSDKSIDVLGFPDYPFVYYTTPMTYAFGGSFINGAGEFTPNNTGTSLALSTLIEYREEFGVDNIEQFNTSARYMDATADPFIVGKQAIRIDGPWYGNHIKNTIESDLDYDIAPLPYPEDNPELAGSGNVTTSIFYMSATSKKKDAAWSFLSWIMEENAMLKFCTGMSNLPARKALLTHPDIVKIQDFDKFGQQAMSPNMQYFPADRRQAEFQSIMNSEIDMAIRLSKPLDEALKATDEQANKLK